MSRTNDDCRASEHSVVTLSGKRTACPNCRTTGSIHAVSFRNVAARGGDPNVVLKCPNCKGEGSIPVEMLEWMDHGERVRIQRVHELKLGLRTAADMWGMKASELSAIEQGLHYNLAWSPPM